MAQGTATVRTNVAQFSGTAADTNSGNKSAGTLRVVLATDQPNPSAVFHVDDNSGSLTVDNGGTFAVQATIASGATSIAKAEDVASADADVGVPALAVRKASPANTSGTDGDYEFLQMSAGRLWASATIDAALPAGANAIGKLAANSGVTIGAVEIAAAQTLATVTTVSTVTSVTAIGTSVTPGTSAGHLGKAEDAAHSSGDTGVFMLSVRKDTATQLAGTDADYAPIITDANGRLHVINSAGVAGDVAHDGVDSGNPIKIGGQAITALPTAVANADRTNFVADKFGRQVTVLGTIRDLVGTQTTTISASTSETTIVTAVASTFLDLVMLIVSNTSTATNTRIDFRDTTAGSVLFSLQSNGGQPPVGFALPVPIPQTTVNTNWTAQCATSTTDVRVYAVFAKNK
jgi:hypothetical protein